MYTMELSRAIATGTRPFDCPFFDVPESGRVLYVEQEIGERGLQERGRKMFTKDLDLLGQNLFYVSKVPELQLDSPAGVRLLHEFVAEVQPNVLVLDPISRLHGYDENDNSQIGQLMHTIDSLIRKFEHNEMSVILIHHMRKKGSNTDGQIDPLSFHNLSGSRRYAGDPDTLITINKLSDYKNSKGQKAWKIASRYETRQSEPPEDLVFTVNDDGDLRVKYLKVAGDGGPPKLDKPEVLKKAPAPEQLCFREGNEAVKKPRF